MMPSRVSILLLSCAIFAAWPAVAAETPASPGPAVDAAAASRFAAERERVARLTASPLAVDKRALGDLLASGVLASADNPLRSEDPAAAALAYRAAIDAGDGSPATLVALAKIVLNADDPAQIQALVPALRQATYEGDGEAAYILALAVREGGLASEDSAAKLLASAAVAGSLSATLDLVRGGTAVPDTVRAVILEGLKAKAAGGNAKAMATLSHIHREGILVARDEAAATGWLERAVERGDAASMVELANRLVHGLGTKADPDRARALLTRAAEGGSVEAAMALGGDAMALGQMAVSQEDGRLWLTRAVAIGAPGAAADLATIDLRRALRRDVAQGDRGRMIEAALAPVVGDAEALSSLAARFRTNPDGRLLADALLPMLHERTVSGSTVAGLAYDAWLRVDGAKLPADASEALTRSLHEEADEGLSSAVYTLAALSLDERLDKNGIPREEAIELLFRAADGHVGQAMLRIAKMYAYGQTLAKSEVFAKRWYKSAAALDVEAARWGLADLQLRSDDEAERAAGERFYRERIDAGDPRAAAAYVAFHLRRGTLDDVALARAEALVKTPEDAVGMARVLSGSTRPQDLETTQRLLEPYIHDNPDPDALVIRARVLLDAGTPDEVGQGIAMLGRAVALGSDDAKLALADVYLSNFAYSARQAEAVEMVYDVLGRNPSSAAARLALSNAYLMGYGVKRDPAKAKSLIAGVIVQSSSKSPEAAILDADWLSFSDTNRDPRRAVSLLSQQVDRGSIAAERAMGVLYLNGFGPSHDADRAAGYLFKAATQGDKEAMAGLGHLFINGMGVARSRDTGIAWLERAANAGNPTAMYDLSRLFALGTKGAVDAGESIAWLKRAAERGHPAATYQLGVAYLTGDGVAKDREAALSWLRRSQSSGNLLAARTVRQVETSEPGAEPTAATLESE